jgi:hypothetical protein
MQRPENHEFEDPVSQNKKRLKITKIFKEKENPWACEFQAHRVKLSTHSSIIPT